MDCVNFLLDLKLLVSDDGPFDIIQRELELGEVISYGQKGRRFGSDLELLNGVYVHNDTDVRVRRRPSFLQDRGNLNTTSTQTRCR
jgi:hypothetical protein